MDISVAKKAAPILVCLILFSTCGELETLFPSNGTYQVGTLVNGSSLEHCSIIRSNDKIRPYFASSVVNDPDLIGLLVYLEDPQGKVTGAKVQYILLPYADKTALTEEDLSDLLEERETETDETTTEHLNLEIAVKSLGAELPCFPLPKELDIGPYVLVFEALGKKETLSRMETNVYYLGSAEFSLKDISMYLPGLAGPQLISPGTVIMLETSLDYDLRLDPYLIWYNGKNIISEGKIREGAGKLLWKAPEQAGFYSLRLEVFPFHLMRSAYNGLSREIALPVSPKAVSLAYFFEGSGKYTAQSPLSAAVFNAVITEDEEPVYPSPELLQWYQFDGGLLCSLSTFTNEQRLLPANETAPRWTAAGQSYGLAIGPDNPYLLPSINFFRHEKDQGGGILLLHIKPLSEGIIFRASFPLESSSLSEGVWMDLIKKENVITLRLSAWNTFVDLPVYPALVEEAFIPIAVEFYIRPYQLEAKISLDENSQNRAGGIKLPIALSGEGKITLGGSKAETFTDTIWDELAILSSAAPLLPETFPIPTAVYETDPVEATDAISGADAVSVEAETVPLTDTDADNSIQEQETQELSVLSESL